VNDAELNGNYAFSFSGIHGKASVASTYAAVGRFTADGPAISQTVSWIPTAWVSARSSPKPSREHTRSAQTTEE